MEQTITQLSTKWQTNRPNVIREYCQNLFLSYLYQQKGSEKILFKGGTALRLIHKSPRFSEDLDFECFNMNQSVLENILINCLAKLEQNKTNTKIQESKKTIGGYLGKIVFNIMGQKVQIKLDFSFRPRQNVQKESSIIENELVPSYIIWHLPINLMTQGKLSACLDRGKPRDFFDIYFLLRANLLSADQKQELNKVLEKIKSQDINFKKELEMFLPRSHQAIIKNFQQTLEQEIQRFIA